MTIYRDRSISAEKRKDEPLARKLHFSSSSDESRDLACEGATVDRKDKLNNVKHGRINSGKNDFHPRLSKKSLSEGDLSNYKFSSNFEVRASLISLHSTLQSKNPQKSHVSRMLKREGFNSVDNIELNQNSSMRIDICDCDHCHEVNSSLSDRSLTDSHLPSCSFSSDLLSELDGTSTESIANVHISSLISGELLSNSNTKSKRIIVDSVDQRTENVSIRSVSFGHLSPIKELPDDALLKIKNADEDSLLCSSSRIENDKNDIDIIELTPKQSKLAWKASKHLMTQISNHIEERLIEITYNPAIGHDLTSFKKSCISQLHILLHSITKLLPTERRNSFHLQNIMNNIYDEVHSKVNNNIWEQVDCGCGTKHKGFDVSAILNSGMGALSLEKYLRKYMPQSMKW